MLYKKNGTSKLDLDLFRHPTAEYRGAPFWAWNCKLEQKELEWQIEVLKKMGFGGAHMHVRTGLDVPYLGDRFMELIKACVRKAKNEGMLAWLYDEDRWPSGAAGGLVTKDKKYRARYLLFTPNPYEEEKCRDYEKCHLLACYDIELDQEGYLTDWCVISEKEMAKHEKWYAYLEQRAESPWYNNQTYVNTLDKAAMDRFIEITYESYDRAISEEFDKTVPAIFTDEPQFTHKSTLNFAGEKANVTLPWTDDLPDTFAAAYAGEDILSGLPELIWERADRQPSVLRYHYHDHICERFTQAFADNCGRWCKEHGLKLTGHMMKEQSLESQTVALGEAMRAYRSFDIPGIDMLCGRFEYSTAKQAQSAVHQYGREGMMSELYGVTNWDFDFRGHKLHGDWQAALGVTVRVPHLAWVSMAGEAKRDYPASINYQSPWWAKYPLIEDHFARVNTALTRGTPMIRVGVIHPVESFWLHWGPKEQTAYFRDSLESNFQNLIKWMLFGCVDFDLISESLLPEQCKKAGAPMKVGVMEYDVILVPGCETLRSSTLQCLENFAEAGGKLIFVGSIPRLENACPSVRGTVLAKRAQHVPFDRGVLLKTLEPFRTIEIRNETGAITENLLYQMRQDKEGQWLFVAHGKEPYNKDISRYQDLKIRVRGTWKAVVYNTLTGEREGIRQDIDGDTTRLYYRMYDYDSLLVWLEPVGAPKDMEECNVKEDARLCGKLPETVQNISLPEMVPYSLSEPNALLLDQAEYALDDGEWQPKEEILRLDDICRRYLKWPRRRQQVAQPWTIKEEPVTHVLHLKWHVLSGIRYVGAQLAIEDAEKLKIKWNHKEIPNTVTGWYVDKSIKTVALPTIQKGENILEVEMPFGKRTNVEWAYLLGDFGVEIRGRNAGITEMPKALAFGNIALQGLPFYGGNITYHIPVETGGGVLKIQSNRYRGVLQEVSVDEEAVIPMIYPPYTAELGEVVPGRHEVHLSLYGHRRNGFGPVHFADLKDVLIEPNVWRSTGERWSYEYLICEEGVLTAPKIFMEDTQKNEQTQEEN